MGQFSGPEYPQSSFINIGKFLHRLDTVHISLSDNYA